MFNFFQNEETGNDINIIIFYQDLLNEDFQNLKEFEEKNTVKKIIKIFSSNFDERIFKEKISKNKKCDWEILEDFVKSFFDIFNFEKRNFFDKENLKKKTLLEYLVIFSYLNLFKIKWEEICQNLKKKENLKILEKILKNMVTDFFKTYYFKPQKNDSKIEFLEMNSTIKKLKSNEKIYIQKINLLEKSNYENEMNYLKNQSLKTIDSDLKKDLVYYKEFKKLAEKNLIDYEKKIIQKESEILNLKNLLNKKKLETPKKNKNFGKEFFSLKNLKKSLESSFLLQKNKKPFFDNKNNDFEKRAFYYKNLSLNLIKELKIFYIEFQKFLILSNLD